MIIGRINGIANKIGKRIERATNMLLNEEAVTERITRANNEVADKFVKLNFDDFPKGSAEEKICDARTMLGKIAKDNGVSFEFERSADDGILFTINKNGKCMSLIGVVDDDIKQTYHHNNRLVGSILLTDKDGIKHVYPRVMKSEDNFLRHLYRTIDEAIKGFK